MCYNSTSYNAHYEKFAKATFCLKTGSSVYSYSYNNTRCKVNSFLRKCKCFLKILPFSPISAFEA